MRIKFLTVPLAALVCAATSTTAQAQSSTTNFSDLSPSVVGGRVGGFESAPVSSTYSDPALLSGDYQYYSPAPTNYYPAAPVPAAAPAKKPNPAVGAHSALFYKNDFSYLTDDYTGPTYLGDGLKNLTLGRGKLDIGGQVRTRYHSERGLGQVAGATRFQDTDNQFGLLRVRAYADYKATDRLRFFAEGIYADTLDRDDQYIPRGIDRNFGDFLNLFVDAKISDNTTVRLGRQELLFGAQRFVSPLDWSNTRRTFDGVSTISKFNDWSVNAFYSQVVPVNLDSFDNPNEDLDFYGAYATYKGPKNNTLDLYYLGFNNDTGPDGTFSLDTFGTRLFGSRGDWLYELEGAAQTGTQNALGQNHEAYFGTIGVGRKLSNARWKPALWFYYDIATGDDVATTGTFERANDLFPLGHKYLGFLDAVQRSNVSSPNVRLSLSPTDKLSFLFWYYNFQSVEASDVISSLGGTPAQDLTSKDFGNELDFVATYKFNPRRSLVLGYSYFWTGDKIIDGEDADFFYLQYTTNF